MDAYNAKIDSIIAKHGYAIQGLLESPPMAYTVGLTELGLPELVMVGIHMETMYFLIRHAIMRMQDDKAFEAGQLQTEIANLPLRVDQVHQSQILGRLHILTEYEMGKGRDPFQIQALQLVWPSMDGFYPDQAEYDMQLEIQPLLSLPYMSTPETMN